MVAYIVLYVSVVLYVIADIIGGLILRLSSSTSSSYNSTRINEATVFNSQQDINMIPFECQIVTFDV